MAFVAFTTSSSSSSTSPQLRDVRRTPPCSPTRHPTTPPRVANESIVGSSSSSGTMWQPYLRKVAQHERLQQCLATNCSGRLGNNLSNVIITVGSRTFGLCETTH
jgi:hypothetical protein